MKLYILYDIKNSMWGGGNQFLKNLRRRLQLNGAYSENIEDADIILFSSHHQMDEVIRAKIRYPDKHFVHRMGSVFTLTRGDKYLDRLVLDLNENIADGTIFQSNWQQQMYHSIGMPIGLETVIINAPDSGIFNTRRNGRCDRGRIRLITTGWSMGDTKGFDIYEHLDEHLDFKKYQFLFIGNTKKKFENIESFPSQISMVVASLLKGSDIFITATEHDACSNSLIEALHCGLPAVARNSGGHPELVKGGGVLFKGKEDVLVAIDKVAENLEEYRNEINPPKDSKITQEYFEFCCEVVNQTKPKKCRAGYSIKHNLMMKRQKTGELVRGVLRG